MTSSLRVFQRIASGHEVEVARPIRSSAIAHAGYTVDADGRHLAAAFVLGSPTVFSVVDTRTGELVFEEATAHHEAAWAVACGRNRHLYFGTANYDIFDFDPDKLTLTKIADRATLGDYFVWRATTDEHGTLYVGTYPNGLIAAFDAEGDRRWRTLASLLDGNQFVHALATTGSFVFAGASTTLPRIYRLDSSTGCVAEIIDLPEQDISPTEFIYDIDIVEDHLFVHLAPQDTLLVWDLARQRWTDRFHEVRGLSVIPGRTGIDPPSTAYFCCGRDLVRYIPGQGLESVVAGFADGDSILRGASWRNDGTVEHPRWTFVTLDTQSAIKTWSPETSVVRRSKSQMAFAEGIVRSLGVGPDDELWVSGFMMADYMVKVGAQGMERVDVPGQSDALGSIGKWMLLGQYPDARLVAIDTTVGLASGIHPRTALLVDNEQDRPLAIESVGAGIAAVATAPKGGRLGGAIVLWSVEANEIHVHRNPILEHKPLCLESRGGTLFIGTGVSGGYGTVATHTDGLLCAYDVETNEIRWQLAVAPGEGHIVAVSLGEDDDLFVLSTRSLTVVTGLDRPLPHVVRRVELWPDSSDEELGVYMRGRSMGWAEGMLIVSNQDEILLVDPATFDRVALARGENVVVANDGIIYYSRRSKLLQWAFEPASEHALGFESAHLA